LISWASILVLAGLFVVSAAYWFARYAYFKRRVPEAMLKAGATLPNAPNTAIERRIFISSMGRQPISVRRGRGPRSLVAISP
jgi:hypothetical protein